MKNNKRIALITGASSGIGAAIARVFASEGISLVLVARKEKELQLFSQKLKKDYSVQVFYYCCDVTNAEAVVSLKKRVKKDVGGIDYLINNAGGSHVTNPEDIIDTAFRSDVDTNLYGTHLCCRHLSSLIRSKGAIVNMSSVNGQAILSPLQASSSIKVGYAVAKAGIVQLTHVYAAMLSKKRIRVNAIAPGGIYPTGMTHDWSKEKQRMVANESLLKRLGKPEDVARAALFLISDNASFITGHTLNVNGGRYMN